MELLSKMQASERHHLSPFAQMISEIESVLENCICGTSHSIRVSSETETFM